MIKFSDLGLAQDVLKAVEAQGYSTPTPIQQEVIPEVLNGRDVLGLAQTGTGKTASFVLPILTQIKQELDRPDATKRTKKSCRALIVVPTRELAQQIVDSIRVYSKFMHPTTALIVGGAKAGPQIRTMSHGVDIVIATPGRLMDHMEAGVMHLGAAKMIVLDEADQMLDMGFVPAIRKIMSKMPDGHQTLLLSATMPPQIRNLSKDFLNRPREISVAPTSKPIEKIEQRIMHVDKAAKRKALMEYLDTNAIGRAIIFVRTKRGAQSLEGFLNKNGKHAVSLHGDKSQGQRVQAMNQFKSNKANMMVATDIAARGIDISDISHVFNFDLPTVPEAYVHRIGRTARAGKEGIAITFCGGDERNLLKDIERTIKMRIPLIGQEPSDVEPYVDDSPSRRGGNRNGGNRGNSNRNGRNVRQEGHRGKPKGEGRSARSDKPRGDRPTGDKPRGDRPARGDRPTGDKPRGDRPARGDRPSGDRPPRGDRPGDRPRSEKPWGDKPRGDRPTGDKPRGDKPRSDKPRGARPSNSASRKPTGKPTGARDGSQPMRRRKPSED